MTKKSKNLEELKSRGLETPPLPPIKRRIIIETDGSNINIVLAEVGGKIEFLGILQSLINHINQQK